MCTVDGYREGDPFVEIDFTIEFMDSLDVGTMQDFISKTIFDERPRVRVDLGDDSYLGNVVGDVVVYYDSLLDYTDIVYDGWILNVTQDAFGLASNPDVFNTSSARFEDVQKRICNAYTEKFNVAENRYRYCFIADVRAGTTQQVTSTTISFLFAGKEPLLEEEIRAVLTDFQPVPIQKKTYYFIGDQFALYETAFEEIKVNVSDYDYLFITTTTTENPNFVISTVQMQFQISNNLTEALADVTSPEFLQTETEFCTWPKGFDDIFGTRFDGSQTLLNHVKYINCSLDQFSSSGNKSYVHVELNFRGEVIYTAENEEILRKVLVEHGQRIDLDPDPDISVAAIKVPTNSTSPTYLYFQSLQSDNIFSASAIQEGPATTPPLRTLLEGNPP